MELYTGSQERPALAGRCQGAHRHGEPGSRHCGDAAAQRHGCRAQQIHDWRGSLEQAGWRCPLPPRRRIGGVCSRSCRIILRQRPQPRCQEASIEVEIAGATVRVSGRPGAERLVDVFSALRRAAMLTPPAGLRCWWQRAPSISGKGADGLAALAKEALGQDPLSGIALVFRASALTA